MRLMLAGLVMLQSCAFVSTYQRNELPTRESLRPTVHHRELLLLQRQETQGRDLGIFVDEAKAEDWGQAFAGLWLVGYQAAKPRPLATQPLGADTFVSLHVDPGLSAAQIVATALSRQGLLRPLFRPWHGHRYHDPSTQYAAGLPADGMMGLRTLRADLHVHSASSHDSVTPLRQIFKMAQANRLDVLAITDHDLLTYREAKRVYQDMLENGEIYRPFVLIPGVEISTSEGHVLAYFVHQPIPPGLDPYTTVAMIHRQGGIAVLAHPHLPGSGINGPRAWNLPVDGVERINGAQLFPLAWHGDRWHTQQISSRGFGSSDAHFAEYVGAAYTEIAVTEASERGVRHGIEAGRLQPRTGNVLMAGFELALANHVSRNLLTVVFAPTAAAKQARYLVASAFGADDFYVQTTWHDVFSDLFTIWQALGVIDYIDDPRHPIHAPPLPSEVGLRYGSLSLFVSTPIRSFRGPLTPELEDRVRQNLGIGNQPAIFFANDRQETFFVWPAGLVAGFRWSWVF